MNQYTALAGDTFGNRRNWIMLALVYLGIHVAYSPVAEASLVLGVCVLVMGLMKVNYAIGITIALYYLIPSDIVAYMFVKSPFGSFPVYILLMLLFILDGMFKRNRFCFLVDRSEFLVYCSLIILTILQGILCIYFSSNVILSNTVKFAFQTVGMLFMVKFQSIQQKELTRIMRFIGFMTLVTVAIAALELTGSVNPYKIYGDEQLTEWIDWAAQTATSWRTKSTFGNPLVFSSTLCISLGATDYLRKNGKVFEAICSMLVIALGMVMTGSRSSIIIMAAFLIYSVIDSEVKYKFYVICGIIIGAVVGLNFADLSVIGYRFTHISGTTSLTHRYTAYGVFWNAFSRYFLLGSGLGNSYHVLSDFVEGAFSVNTFDNSFMDYSLAVGSIGLILTVISLWNAIKLCKYPHVFFSKSVLFLMLGLSFFLNVTKYQSLWGMMWVFIALNMYATPNIEESGKAN